MIVVFFLFATVFFYWIAIPRKRRNIFLLCCSLTFIAFFSPVYALYYFFMSTLVFMAGVLMRAVERKRKKRLFLSILVLLIANLCFYKYYRVGLLWADSVVSRFIAVPVFSIPEIIFPIGLSFITFRLIHYHVEVYRGNIPRTSFVDFSLYALFFPTFIAGPVERFPNFHDQTARAAGMTLAEFNYGLWRILSGMVKKFIIADALFSVIIPVLNAPLLYSRSAVIVSVYGAAIWLYMDFGGYTDMAIGISHLFGYRIMENFNRPFLKKNIALYWRNWHISVYSWIRDYFYFPLFVYRGTPFKLYLGIFCTMVVFMLWHAGTRCMETIPGF